MKPKVAIDYSKTVIDKLVCTDISQKSKATSNKQNTIFIECSAGTGKTTGLLRMFKHLQQ
jgi:ATP-dependent exoDNAse (exonuclease V) beta subunit